MSRETLTWLNTNTLVGFTDKRGNAWHYRASEQGDESNHYPGAIPVTDVLRRLFSFQVIELPLLVAVPASADDMTSFDEDGNAIRHITLSGRKAIARDDTMDVLGVFKDGYQPHQYSEWLLDNVSTILDDTLAIGSAGLLRNGAQGFVSVEMPENISTPEGVEFRPNLLACTSCDGSLATTYKRVVTVVVCDNTLAAGLNEKGQTFKVRHSKYSGNKIESARDALNIVYSMVDDFAAEVTALTQWEVSDSEWSSFLEAHVPITDSKRSATVGAAKREVLDNLYRFDNRCAPWAGTAFGVLQAVNTYTHHLAPVHKTTIRAERNMTNALTDAIADSDAEAMTLLRQVCSV